MKNRHIKCGFTIPIKTLERLDKKTTYKGFNRSRWIVGAINDKLDKTNTPEPLTERQMMVLLHNNTKDLGLKAYLAIKINPEYDKWIITSPEYDEIMRNPTGNRK